MIRLCGIQSVLTVFAFVAAVVEVETIIWTGPTIAAFGLWIAVLSVKRVSAQFLAFGLLSPIVTSLIALLIATFDIGPGTASRFVWAPLLLNAIVTIALWLALRRRVGEGTRESGDVGDGPVRFSIMHMLMGITLTCLVLSVLRLFSGRAEMAIFACYGIVVLMASIAIVFWFSSRSKSLSN